MFGVSESYAALCLIVFMVGSACGMLLGGFFADRVSHHERVAAVGLMAAAALHGADRDAQRYAGLLLLLCSLRGVRGRHNQPSRDMIVRQATPPGASGKVFGFVYSGLDVGSFLAPPLFG